MLSQVLQVVCNLCWRGLDITEVEPPTENIVTSDLYHVVDDCAWSKCLLETGGGGLLQVLEYKVWKIGDKYP
jgi:hypothetical protein